MKNFIDEMLSKNISLNAEVLGYTLLGAERKIIGENEKQLSFFGKLKGKTTYEAIEKNLKAFLKSRNEVLEQEPNNGDEKANSDDDNFFEQKIFNTMPEEMKQRMAGDIASMRIVKPATNSLVRDMRKLHPRAFEPWNEQEKKLFASAVQHTKDIHFLYRLFRRNPGSLKMYFKMMREG